MRALFPALGVGILLLISVFAVFEFSKPRASQIILPGGITYLGPSPSTPSTHSSPSSQTWSTQTGKIFPYSFSYPSSLSLGVFPNDPTDGVTLFQKGTEASANLFFRVEKLDGKPMEHAQNWWKQYAWNGVESVTAFTNSKGLKGYRAKYLDATGNTPYDHVFFEIPDHKDLMIWLSGKLFSQEVFDTIVDSVDWK